MEPKNVKLSLIVAWRGGDPLREKALCQLADALAHQRFAYGNDHHHSELIIVTHQTDIGFVPVLNYPYTLIELKSDNPEFNKSWCMNVGARQATSDHLVFVDADTLFGLDYILIIKKRILKMKPSLLLLWNYMIAMPGRDNPVTRFIQPDRTLALGGVWYCHRDFYFQQFGGMNEDYWGYGGEDNEAYGRVRLVMNLRERQKVQMMEYPLAHQYHHWAPRSKVAVPLLNKARENFGRVTELLKQQPLGNVLAPCSIGNLL